MNESMKINRREFLKTSALVGGNLLVAFYLPFGVGAEPSPAKAGSFAPNAFIRIDSEGVVTFTINKSELGQGAYTALPMLLAEELEVDLKAVRLESAPVDPVYNSPGFAFMMTAGSASVRSEWERLSKAGAAAREMLIAAAAETWKVDPKTCRAESGKVIHAGGQSLPYGKLVEKASRLSLPTKVKLKDPSDYKIVGKPVSRLDSLAKANGTAQYGLDVSLPGMLTAVIARSPVFGGQVVSFKGEEAKAVPGVVDLVQVSSGIAVVANGFWAARQGLDKLQVTWNEGQWAELDTSRMRKEYAKLSATPGAVARKEGDAAIAIGKAAKKLAAEYEVPYLAHAALEPLNIVVDLRKDACDIWTGNQCQTDIRDTAARISGLKPEQVAVHTPFVGGGFGRKASFGSPWTIEAVELAKALKKPVKVIWTREDDIQGGYYRPMWSDRIAAGLDDKNNLVAWSHTIVGQSLAAGSPFEAFMVKDGVDSTSVEGAADLPYKIPNLLVDLHSPRNGVPVFFWRSVGHSHTAFVVEGFLDEVAHAAGQDPFEFRRNLLKDKPRHLKVLELAAQKAGWQNKLPDGRGRGIAVHESFGSFVAQVAEVSVDPKGEVRVHRVVCVIDCGRYVNPNTVEAQMEGGIVFGLSAALHGAITLKAGRVEQSNFHDYPVLRISEAPEIEVHLVQSQENPGGVGEPGVPPIAPAVANAIFAATRARLRTLPMTPQAVLAAMKG